MTVTNKDNFVELVIADDDMKTIENAAKLSNVSISSYIQGVVLKQARLDLSQNETIVLNDQERDALMNALAKPIEPNDALKRLLNN